MPSIRSALLSDLNTLLTLENTCFHSDRIKRRQFRYLLTRGHARILIAESNSIVLGYILVLFNRATSIARIYSIAVAKCAQKQGIGKILVAAAEAAALEAECSKLSLEIRRDNLASQRLFEHAGYRCFKILLNYYEDHSEALRYEKILLLNLT